MHYVVVLVLGLGRLLALCFLRFYIYIYVYIYNVYIYVDSSVRRLDSSKLENQIVSTHTNFFYIKIKSKTLLRNVVCGERVSLLKRRFSKISHFATLSPTHIAHLMFPLFRLFCSSCFVNQLTFEKITNTMLRLDRCVRVGVSCCVCVSVCVCVSRKNKYARLWQRFNFNSKLHTQLHVQLYLRDAYKTKEIFAY